MDKKTLAWLTAGPAWLRYAVESQLLDKQPDIQPVLEDKSIRDVVARLKSVNAGIPAIKSGRVHYTETGKAYWDLFFLADIGLQIRDLGLEAEAEQVFRFQSADGSLTMPPNVRDDYFCMSAILVASLTRMGYRDDPRIAHYIQAVMRMQLANGGWDCYGDSYGRESCPMDDLNVLMLLGQYERYRESPALNASIDLLLAHWEDRTNRYGFGVGQRFRALAYPAVKYGILRVLDVLALFPYAVASRSFQSMLDFVHAKAMDGRYTPEAADSAFAAFDFGQTKEPSRWLTFLIERIEKRAAGDI